MNQTLNVSFSQLVNWEKNVSDSSILIPIWRCQETFWCKVLTSSPKLAVTRSLGNGRFLVTKQESIENYSTCSRAVHCFLCLLVIPALVMLIARVCFRFSQMRFQLIEAGVPLKNLTSHPLTQSPRMQQSAPSVQHAPVVDEQLPIPSKILTSPLLTQPAVMASPALEQAEVDNEDPTTSEQVRIQGEQIKFILAHHSKLRKALEQDDLENVKNIVECIRECPLMPLGKKFPIHPSMTNLNNKEIFKYVVGYDESPDAIQSIFFSLITSDNQKKVEFLGILLEKHPKLAQCYDSSGLTGMHYASLMGNQAICKLLQDKTVEQPSTKPYIFYPFHGITNTFNACTTSGVRLPSHLTPIQMREYFYHLVARDALLAHIGGKTYGQPQPYQYPLPWGDTASWKEICTHLSKTYLNDLDDNGLTLLHYAYLCHDSTLAEALIKMGANQEIHSTAPITIDFSRATVGTFCSKISSGYSPEEFGKAAKTLIAHNKLAQLVRGSEQEEQQIYLNQHKRSSCQDIEQYRVHSPMDLETAKSWMSAEKISKKDSTGLTLLHYATLYATLYENKEVAKILLDLGADDSPSQVVLSINTFDETVFRTYSKTIIIDKCRPTEFTITLLTTDMIIYSLSRTHNSDPNPFSFPSCDSFAWTEKAYLSNLIRKNLNRWFEGWKDIDKPIEISPGEGSCTLLRHLLIQFDNLARGSSQREMLWIEEAAIKKILYMISTLLREGADLFSCPIPNDCETETLFISDYEILINGCEKIPAILSDEMKGLVATLKTKRQNIIRKELENLPFFPTVLNSLVSEYMI